MREQSESLWKGLGIGIGRGDGQAGKEGMNVYVYIARKYRV